MNLKDFYCDSFELRLKFAAGEMDTEAFLKAFTERGLETEVDEDGDRDVFLSFGSHEATIAYHAHVRLVLKKDGGGKVNLSYHLGPLEDKNEEPPYVEDSTKWLSGFFKKEKFAANINANYTFDKSFTPVINLPFPLPTSENVLVGALVTGLSLLLPSNGTFKKSVVIQSAEDETYIFFRTEAEIDLNSFDLFSELSALSSVINPLVKKRGSNNETSQAQTE